MQWAETGTAATAETKTASRILIVGPPAETDKDNGRKWPAVLTRLVCTELGTVVAVIGSTRERRTVFPQSLFYRHLPLIVKQPTGEKPSNGDVSTCRTAVYGDREIVSVTELTLPTIGL